MGDEKIKRGRKIQLSADYITGRTGIVTGSTLKGLLKSGRIGCGKISIVGTVPLPVGMQSQAGEYSAKAKRRVSNDFMEPPV